MITPPGDSFVHLYDDNMQPPVFPVAVGPGESKRFWAFYTPGLPDWENGLSSTHKFDQGDHLEVIIAGAPSQVVRLIGESTKDSDITYDGVVDPEDLGRLDNVPPRPRLAD